MESGEKIISGNSKIILKLAFILTLLAFIYHSTFLWLYERYISADSYYSHGFIVPFVTVFLIWLKRRQLRLTAWNYSFPGAVLILCSLSAHIISIFAQTFFLSGFSFIFLIFGICLFLFGKEITKNIIFPLAFLIFMIPLPLVAINAVSFPMKMFVTKSVVLILKTFMNLPITNEGFQIFFPRGSLIVENPCSGLRSLITMLALGSIFAYLSKESMPKRILLFLLAFPIAIFSNMIRVILLCLAVFIYGNKMSEGFFHDFSGYLVFIIAFCSLWKFWGNFNEKI